jgi:TolB protein
MVGDWRRAVLMVSDLRGAKPRALSDTTAGWFNLAWSPRDRSLAASHLGSDGVMQVWAVDLPSGRCRVLAAFDSTRGRPQWPTWSPDGRRIAVQAGRYDRRHPETNEADVWIVDVASGEATKVGARTGTWMDEAPSWCPDGRRIVFQSSRTGRFEIWCMNVDGSGARSLTP